MSNLPILPSGFGRDSAYPPMPSYSPSRSPVRSPRRTAQSARHTSQMDVTAHPRLAFMSFPDEDATMDANGLELPVGMGHLLGVPRSSSHGDVANVSYSRSQSHPSLDAAFMLSDTTHPGAGTDMSMQYPGPAPHTQELRRPASFEPLRAHGPTAAAGMAPAPEQPVRRNPFPTRHAPSDQPETRVLSGPAGPVSHAPPAPPRRPAPTRPTEAPSAAVPVAPPAHRDATPEARPTRQDATTEAPPTSRPVARTAIRVALPDVDSLRSQRERAEASGSETDKLRWSVQVLKMVERMQTSQTPLEDPVPGWIEEAIAQIVQCASHPQPPAEALYARGDLLASGAFPEYVAKDLRSAFNDFELSARMGWAPSWFRIGRDYETLGDVARACTAYTRGVQSRDVGSMYRMGMAKVLGQLDLPVNLHEGLSLLQAAADGATVDTPHPAYIFALILTGELASVPVSLDAFAEAGQPAPTRATLAPLAREYLERAAYLNLAAAQTKCGWCYEHAQHSFPFDPLMSVQYYSAASQGGEPEADMALSKWFLCGAEGFFDKNEKLAWTFAERAATHGIPNAEFALGYYLEVGIGTASDIDAAQAWYAKAAAHDHQDAKDRLAALQTPQPDLVSRATHAEHLQDRVYTEHQRARSQSKSPAQGSADLVRKRTLQMAEASARRRQVEPAPAGRASTPSSRSSAAAASASPFAASPASSRRRSKNTAPQTFSEMGYPPKSDKDCVIA